MHVFLKALGFLGTVTLVLFPMVDTALAQACDRCIDAPGDHIRAYGRNIESGALVDIPVRQEIVYYISTNTEKRAVVRYIVDIPTAILMNYTRESRTDSSVSYRLTLTQYYEELYEEGLRYIAVEEYAGEWESLDPQVTGIEGYLRAGVNGPVWGGGFLYQRQDSPHFTPGDWAVRTLVPSWAGIYVHVSDDFGFYQCGQTYVKLLRQPTGYTWEFWFNICKGETWPGEW